MLRSAEVQPVFQDLCIQCASACWMTILPSPFLPSNKIPPSSACLCSPHNGETTRQATPCNSTTWTCTEKVLVRVVVLFPSRAQRSGRNIFIRQSTYHNPTCVISPLAIFYKAFREHHSDMLPGMVEVLYSLQAQDGPTVRNSNGQDFFLGASPCTLCVGRALASETAGRNFFYGAPPYMVCWNGLWCVGTDLFPSYNGQEFFYQVPACRVCGNGLQCAGTDSGDQDSGQEFFYGAPAHRVCGKGLWHVGMGSGYQDSGQEFFYQVPDCAKTVWFVWCVLDLINSSSGILNPANLTY